MTNDIFTLNEAEVNLTIDVKWQGGEHQITAEEITDSDAVDSIVAALPQGSLSLAIGESSLISNSWDHIVHVAILYQKMLLAGLQVTAADLSGRLTGSLFDVAKGLVGVFAEPTHRGNLIKLACYAATIDHPSGVLIALNQIKERLTDLRTTGYRISDLRAISEEFESFVAVADTALQRNGDAWPSSPVPQAMMPEGWTATDDGILTPEGKLIPAKAVISQIQKNIGTDEVSYTVNFNTGDGWHSTSVIGSELFNNRTAIKLADQGFPITSNNSPVIVEYLHLYIQLNRDLLSNGLVTSQLGWIVDGQNQHGFQCGNQFIPSSDESPPVTFRGKDTGDQQIVGAISSKGSPEEWFRAWGLLRNYPKALLILYASFASTLLKVLQTSNFVLSIAGPTSTGKSTVLRIAGSVWGNPDMTSRCSYIESWDATKVGREMRIGLFGDHPVIFDDTKNAHSETDVSQTVYDVATGRGRTRGTPKGLRQITAARTILLTSGEESIASFSEDGGVRGRILELRHPYGQTNQDVGVLVRQLDRIVVNNFGHAGPLFVRAIINLQVNFPDELQHWMDFFNRRKAHFIERAGSSHVAARLAPYLASIEVAAHMCHQIFQVEFGYEDTVDQLWEELTRESQDADRSATALRFLLDHAISHKGKFKTPMPEDSPHNGWLGIWRKPVGGQSCLVFYRDKADEELERRGFKGLAMRKAWAENGWILQNGNAPYQKIRDTDGTINCVVIPQRVIDDLNGDGE